MAEAEASFEIAHTGGAYRGHERDIIRPVYRGEIDPSKPGYRIAVAPAWRLDWSHDGSAEDIIAYEVIEPGVTQ